MANFGYNRDGKKGKKQIVIGLLCDQKGDPLSIQAFEGNTQDVNTFKQQVEKVKARFNADSVTMVGDRGMIKTTHNEALEENGFYYISAITKPQIETLLKNKTIQLGLFDEEVSEVLGEDGIRYILRRNPVRAEEMRIQRNNKLEKVEQTVNNFNTYLAEHPRAKVETWLNKANQIIKKLNIGVWLEVYNEDRNLILSINHEKLQETSKLDGCYVIKTTMPSKEISAHEAHDRYKDLALVEKAFRVCKTVQLEMRPVYVRRKKRTEGHLLVVMLAYKIYRYLFDCWKEQDLTVEEGINYLDGLCTTNVTIKNRTMMSRIPDPNKICEKLLNLSGVQLPKAFDYSQEKVSTRKKLAS